MTDETFATGVFNKLMYDAAPTAGIHMRGCVEEIDTEFGAGYAEKHPELLGQMIQAAAMDLHTAAISKAMGGLNKTISYTNDALVGIADALEK